MGLLSLADVRWDVYRPLYGVLQYNCVPAVVRPDLGPGLVDDALSVVL